MKNQRDWFREEEPEVHRNNVIMSFEERQREEIRESGAGR